MLITREAVTTVGRLRVSIDPLVCACTGYCVQVVPAVFDLSGDGPTVVLDPHPPLDLLDSLSEAETLCPTHAIRVQVLPGT
ncbi:MAG TPA: ferredoxin [Actinobacteria bacterium]|nr:ferredoxin [Actinomycetota bacterium]